MMTTENLIPLVFSKPELWDQSSKNYSSKEMKLRAWQFIAEKLNVTANEAKVRWTNLRDLFRRELKKTVKSARMTGDPEAYVPRWRHFKTMLFLKDQIMKDGEELELPSLAYDESLSATHYPDVIVDEEDCGELEEDYFRGYSPSSSPNHMTVAVMPQTSGRKKNARITTNGYSFDHQRTSKRQRVQKDLTYVDAPEDYGMAPVMYNNETDEDYHFVMSILGSVRRIRPDRKTLFKMKVLQLIMDEESYHASTKENGECS